ncbi:MAG: family 1 encapsulin nanocompartment shell protein [Acidobacteriota bacterium]
MNILRRELAPITEAAWGLIDHRAKEVLQASLSGRRVVDVDGPKGWEYSSVPLGRLTAPHEAALGEVGFGLRAVQPLVESRIIFELDVWELDNASRGAEAIELGPLEASARRIATFEETAIYEGFAGGGIRGLRECTEHERLRFSGDPSHLLEAVAVGLARFAGSGVDGPYVLVAGSELWQAVSEHSQDYPLKKHLERLLGNPLILSPFLQDTVLVSLRGGDLKLTLGQDFAIGYHSHDTRKVQLYLTETFTFRVLDGAAVISIEWDQG